MSEPASPRTHPPHALRRHIRGGISGFFARLLRAAFWPEPDPEAVLFFSGQRMQMVALFMGVAMASAIWVMAYLAPHSRLNIGEHLIMVALAAVMGLNARRRFIPYWSPLTVASVIVWIELPFFVFWTYATLDGDLLHLCTGCAVLLLYPNAKDVGVALFEIVMAIALVVVLMYTRYGYVHWPSMVDWEMFVISALAGLIVAYATHNERSDRMRQSYRLVAQLQGQMQGPLELQQSLSEQLRLAASVAAGDAALARQLAVLADALDAQGREIRSQLQTLGEHRSQAMAHIGARQMLHISAVIDKAHAQMLMLHTVSRETLDAQTHVSMLEDFALDGEPSEVAQAVASVMTFMLHDVLWPSPTHDPTAPVQNRLYLVCQQDPDGRGRLEFFRNSPALHVGALDAATPMPPPDAADPAQAAAVAVQPLAAAPTGRHDALPAVLPRTAALPAFARAVFQGMEARILVAGPHPTLPDRIEISFPEPVQHG